MLIEEGRYTVGGMSWHIRVDGYGPPLLLLHGFTGSWQSWDRFIPALQQDYTVVRVDLPGHGWTVIPRTLHLTMQETVDGLNALMHALGCPTYACVGYSFGGRVALALACEHPESVATLFLESASPGLETAEARAERAFQDERLAERIERMGAPAFAAEWGRIPLFASQQRVPEPALRRQFQIRRTQMASGLAASLRGLGTGAQPSYWPHLAKVRAATLLVTGEEDAKFTGLAERMQASIPLARHRVVPKAGHNVHLEQPDVWLPYVKDFLSEQGRWG